MVPPCPHQQIIDLYHRHLPELQGVVDWTPKRRSYLQSRWREAAKRQRIEWWERFFTYIHESDFLCGRAKSKDGGKSFKADLEWIITQGNFVKIIEGKYHE